MSEESPTQAPDKGAASADAEFVDVEDTMRIELPKPPRTMLFMSLLGLLLAATALAGVAWLMMQPAAIPAPAKPDTTALDALAAQLHSGDKSLAELQQQLDELASSETASADQLQRLQRQLEKQMNVYGSLPGRLSNVENSMAAIQGISAGDRENWLLAEAEYYMQIANAQLQLVGNPHLARLALLQADERIQQLANPALMNIRRALSNELRALEIMPQPDIEGITLTLASVASTVDALPLRQAPDQPTADNEGVDAELSGLDRAMASFKSTLSDVVSVRRSDKPVRPLIAPEAAYFLRTNLMLQLQVARLALLRGETAVFRQSLADADTWLGEYYDSNSTQVRSARQTIAEIADDLFDMAVPDIFESLRLLRQYRVLAAVPADVNQTVETQSLPAGQ